MLAVGIISAYEMEHESSEERLVYNRMKQQGGKNTDLWGFLRTLPCGLLLKYKDKFTSSGFL